MKRNLKTDKVPSVAMVPTQPLGRTDRIFLRLQRICGWAFFALVGPGSWFTMRIIRHNRIRAEDVVQARRIYKEALASGRPTLVCANHLTMVDSAYLHWAFAPLWEYALHYQRFSWNVAAIEHVVSNVFLRIICFLGKTVPIDRGGEDAHRKKVLNKLRWIVQSGEVLTMFPEGSRSRTGRIDPATVTYGVGQILKDLERPQVLCAYLRASRQEQIGRAHV